MRDFLITPFSFILHHHLDSGSRPSTIIPRTDSTIPKMPRSRRSAAPSGRSAPVRPSAAPSRPNVTTSQPTRTASTAAHPPATAQQAGPPAQAGKSSGLFGNMASTAAYESSLPTVLSHWMLVRCHHHDLTVETNSSC